MRRGEEVQRCPLVTAAITLVSLFKNKKQSTFSLSRTERKSCMGRTEGGALKVYLNPLLCASGEASRAGSPDPGTAGSV